MGARIRRDTYSVGRAHGAAPAILLPSRLHGGEAARRDQRGLLAKLAQGRRRGQRRRFGVVRFRRMVAHPGAPIRAMSGFRPVWVAQAIAAYRKLHDRDSLAWMQQAAFDRGSFASLLGVTRPRRRPGRGAGDRRQPGGAVRRRPCHCLLPLRIAGAVRGAAAAAVDQPGGKCLSRRTRGLAGLSVEWDLGPLDDPALLCVTDALGCWILSQRDREPSPIARLRAIAKPRAFARFVEEERAAGRMRRDDTTLLAYWHWSAEPDGEAPPC